MSAPSAATSSWFRPPAGSSSRRSLGSAASARASSTRLRVPKGSPAAGCSATRLEPEERRRAPAAASRDLPLLAPAPHGSAERVARGSRCRSGSARRPSRSGARSCVGNSARFWKVRPMPERGDAVGRGRERSTCPRSASVARGRACRAGDRQLKSVVLPAPLGPISPTIWPGAMSKETSSSATMPPKRIVTLRTDRISAPTAGIHGSSLIGGGRRFCQS